MRRDTYDSLARTLALPFNAWPHCKLIARRYGVPVQTVISIYSQESQQRVIRTHPQLKANIYSYAQRYLRGQTAAALAAEADFPPCIFLRRLLEQLPLGISKQRVNEILKAPETLPLIVRPPESLPDLPQLLRRLEADVRLCVELDGVYSPASDALRHSTGLEYESVLYDKLRAAGIAFWSEDSLRTRGFFKTPDAKLQVPIAVDGRIVNWVDSKATFGDERMHRQQMVEQYQKYVNRYGPGMVVYWFGFIDELQEPAGDVLLAADFPPESAALTTLRLLPLPALGVPPELEPPTLSVWALSC